MRWVLLTLVLATAAAAEEPAALSGACGVSEHTIAVLANEPRFEDKVDGAGIWAGGAGSWCAIEMDFIDEPTSTRREEHCFQLYLQRWSDWPGCPGAKLVETLGLFMPPNLRDKVAR